MLVVATGRVVICLVRGCHLNLRPDNPAEVCLIPQFPTVLKRTVVACGLFLFSTIHAQEKIRAMLLFPLSLSLTDGYFSLHITLKIPWKQC